MAKPSWKSGRFQARHPRIFTAPLPDPVAENIDAIMEIHRQEAKTIPIHEQVLAAIAAGFSRPAFLYVLMVALGLWLSGHLIDQTHLLPFSMPTFHWAEQGLDAAALLISTGVLIRQNRQESFAEQRTQLMLQLSLLSEKKIAKLIELMEELRQDLPNIKQRYDPEAAMMQEAADPLTVLEALKETLEGEIEVIEETEGIEDIEDIEETENHDAAGKPEIAAPSPTLSAEPHPCDPD